MICKECGAKIDDGSLECRFCGAIYGNEVPQEPVEPDGPIAEETYGYEEDTDDTEELFDENEAKRQLQIEKMREEKQAQLEEIEKRRKNKKRRQRRNRVLIVLLILLVAAAIVAGFYYAGSTLGDDDEDYAVVVTPAPTKEPEPVWTPVISEEPEGTEEPETTEEPESAVDPLATVQPVGDETINESAEVTDAPVVSYATEKPMATKKPAATQKPAVAQKPAATKKPTVNPVVKTTKLTNARITGGEVIKANGKSYMSFIYNNKWYYANVSDNTTTKFIAWKQMTINAYNKGETYKGVPVFTITKITHHDNSTANNTPSGSAPQTNGSYVFAESSTRLLTDADLQGKSAYELRIARNEIYARHGRTFSDTTLQNYFNSCSWYKPNSNYNYSNDNANLNSVEKKNITTIRNYENSIK